MKGYLKKGSLEKRESYRFVIDMERLKKDMAMNSINERSFVCRDRSFFKNGFSLNEPSTNGRRDGLGPREEEKKAIIEPKQPIRK